MPKATGAGTPLYRARRSRIHGRGVYAARRIRKGARIIEYTGDRISHDEADRRYEDRAEDDNHTFLFIVDRRTVMDAGVGGNDARFINHSCDPNCQADETDGRVFIEALRDLAPGEELFYDYGLVIDEPYTKNLKRQYVCRCGADGCRGTLLAPKR